ncbi:MAG: phosphate/phosphite/phosphonate ABC transporter substrate-binding protein [Candidatus Scalindua rubra]|uniref:Uncharacterized protein n=1 Tax=Candidatus Scalindua brodae TaxID=237368 RepID=A0A0B0ESC6_9BACT|nr:MAG: hypothetical protein SCABRO_00181 [Candidatus Scalindua brodae]MBZ0110536.1 phosphate/phosphite/phosphonate ABC transporter substrate-binding protein [Candidatus Scalindua rubra]TWU30776.1 hypothetical protein S225a_24330 [Candidatus Brocadiaceae bacterium S225]
MIIRLIITICLFVGTSLSWIDYGLFANPRSTVYFYNPETNINNFASLKSEFDEYLSHHGPFQFQPFSDRDTFEKFIIESNDGVFILSSWHFHDLFVKFPIDSVCVGTSKGKSTQKKILSLNGITTNDNFDLLMGKKVASAGNEEYTRNVIKQMLGEEKAHLVDCLKILRVPKEIDALMALGFGMADLAITSENSLSKLAILNPKQYKGLRLIAKSNETLLPILATPKHRNDNIDLLLTVIEKMGTNPEGVTKLKMLGIDGWKRLGKIEKTSLED